MKVTLGAFETINKNQVNFGLKSKKNNVQNTYWNMLHKKYQQKRRGIIWKMKEQLLI